MVIEILSPSTSSKDLILKYIKYMNAGVREYWVVDHEAKVVRVSLLKDGKFDFIDYINPETIPVQVLEGCVIDMKRAFGEEV
jgi:Uma2 family endonuclease